MKKLDELEFKIAKFLRFGVIFTGVVILAGWLKDFKIHDDPFFMFQTYDRISFEDLISNHLQNDQWGAIISYVGLALLITLPLIRVFLTALIFLKNKEWALSIIATVVLFALIASFTFGIVV